MNAAHPRDQIPNLHGLYVRLSGRDIRLTMSRIFVWESWLTHGWNAGDLAALVRHLRDQVAAGRRNPGALKFENLIGDSDKFEEDLAELRAQSRPRPPSTKAVQTGPTQRIVPNANLEDTSQSAGNVLESPAFKAFVELKKHL
jgi:hypothetical protein